jgi:hypothetical protein
MYSKSKAAAPSPFADTARSARTDSTHRRRISSAPTRVSLSRRFESSSDENVDDATIKASVKKSHYDMAEPTTTAKKKPTYL